MPKRTDINKILVIGSGPVVIGQGAEFDYSGTQACKALREEGYKVILVNSNPATIMTDLDMADIIYIEPLTLKSLTAIIDKERPDALLPTIGGQTGLNLAMELWREKVLEKYRVEVIGTSISAIENAEDREKFRALLSEIGEPMAGSLTVDNLEVARAFAKDNSFPIVIRPAYTLGGTGGGIAFNEDELERITSAGLSLSPINQVLVEKATLGIHGWGEFEMEVLRDKLDNCIIVCPMENFDPMGVHTGESIVVAPTQTLNDRDFQRLRSSAIKIVRALKIEGACNAQFAFNYETGAYSVIEVNPRVSRSSALASKATGYPIARVAAKIAVGMSLDEIPNEATRETKACFEPAIDYVVVKIPRWPFDKFQTADKRIGTQMKSTGETMAMGRTFEEALQKAIRSLEVGRFGLGHDPKDTYCEDRDEIIRNLKTPTHKRILYIRDAIRLGMGVDEIHALTGINRWFLEKINNIHELGEKIAFNSDSVLTAKRNGFSDVQIANITGKTEAQIRKFRADNKIQPTYKIVDTCAAEFKAYTPYLYSTYEQEDESCPTNRKKVLIVGGGPIRIGQGIEFDYCCVHSVFALKEKGIEAVIVNNNPETVSTDFDISDKLYFEPLTYEDVLNIIEREKPYGVILQFGGQTPINMAMKLKRAGVNILGTKPESIDITEDRKKFGAVLEKLGIPASPWGTAFSAAEAAEIAAAITYPVLIRPSYVLGGRGMRLVNNEAELLAHMTEAIRASAEHPVLVDKFLNNAVELDVDAVSDGKDVYIAAIMEHIEEAGIHSGDSTTIIPPQNLSAEIKAKVLDYTTKLAKELNIIGLMNIQYAVQNGIPYVLEVNPRASRTVPFVSKTTGVPLAKVATKVMLGQTLKELGLTAYREPGFVSVKAPVFPFLKLFGVDPVLGPEMKSTGEVMGIDEEFGKAFYKAMISAGARLPKKGNIFLSIAGACKTEMLPVAKGLLELGFELYCTDGTGEYLLQHGVANCTVPKLSESPRIIQMMKNKDLNLVINIPQGKNSAISDGYRIRRACVELLVPYITTVTGAAAALKAIRSRLSGGVTVRSMEDYLSVK